MIGSIPFDMAFARGAAAELERRAANLSNLPAARCPYHAERAAASGDDPLSYVAITSSGSAVEAGRPANPSTAGEGYCCPVCASEAEVTDFAKSKGFEG